jgi:eukaryotic-like serine/threonine-protein kinase
VVQGELTLGRFRILDRIGSGGMGTVYRARDERLGREVAVKEVPGAIAARASREAKAAARLNHSCVATLYELAADGRGAILVSELARGRPLGDLLAAGELTDRDVGEVGLDLAAALAHAHSRGVVHRDVKPANVLVDVHERGARAKLMDFGIAALAGEARLTATGEVVGTLAYMAPEQANGHEAGPEADVYSLALTLYEGWAGWNPIAAATPAATARRIGAEVPSLAEARPDLPEPLIATVDACLVAEPEARPAPGDLTATLEHELGALDAEMLLAPTEEGAPETARHRRLVPVLAALALAALLALLAGPPAVALAAILALSVLAFGWRVRARVAS